MGWSQELADFSEGFGAGFNMVRSRDEREADKLALERSRGELEQQQYDKSRRPILEGREQKLFDLEVQRQEGVIDDQEYNRQRREITAGQEDKVFELDVETRKGTLEQQEHERERRPVVEKREDEAANITLEDAKNKLKLSQEDMTPERVELRKTVAEAERLKAIAEQKKAEAEADPANIKKAQDAKDAETAESLARTRLNNANAAAAELENKQTENFMKVLEGKTRDVEGRGQLPEVYDPQAVPADDTPDPDAEEAPGPTSAVEVPEATTSTYDPPDTGAEAARPLVEEEAVPTEAAPAEPTPVTSKGRPNKSVATTEAGPRQHPHVDEQQNRLAGTRKKPLDASTVNVLEYAGSNAGINAVVYSGGQAGKGEEGPRTGSTRHDHGLAADVKLYDSKTGRLLDMRNPEDAERMRDFAMYAVQAGATGIGAGEGYMGNSSMHIGFGKEASWGGAPWIQDALAQGKATRDKMTSLPGGSDVTKMFQDGSIHKSAKNAALAGMKYAIGSHGLDQDSAVNTPENDDAAYSFMSGDFGADAEQVEEVENVVQNIAKEAGFEINEAEKPMYALAAVYEAYLAVGKPDEAEKAAGALYGHYKKLFGQYGAVAKAAMSQGDVDAAVEAAAKAYANVPDGYDVQFSQLDDGRYEVVMTNQETKEITHRQIATPQEIGGLIMEINPGHFDQFMASAAGVTEKEGTLSPEFTAAHPELEGMTISEAKEHRLIGGGVDEDTGISTGGEDIAGKPKKGPKPAERTEIVEGVTKAFEDFSANAQATAGKDEAYLAGTSDLMMDIKPIAQQVAIDNFGTLEPDLAVEAIVRMVDQEPVSARASEDGKTITITMDGVPEFTMNGSDYKRLAVSRARFGENEPGTQTQAEFNQRLGDLRRTTAPGILPDYDPTRYPVGEVVGGEAVPAAAAPSIYAPREPAVFDPNATYAPWEAIKQGFGALTAVPEGSVPGYNRSGRAGAGPVRRYREDRETREREEYAKPKIGKPRSSGGGSSGRKLINRT